MDPSDIVAHYGQESPIEQIKSKLLETGIDLKSLLPADIAGVDEFHLGGRIATIELLSSIRRSNEMQILDVGCGVGGVARTIASIIGCNVTGIDLTPGFVHAASELSFLVGLEPLTSFEVADATSLRFEDDRFDVVTLVHVGMNIADKRALFAELARVLKPGGSVHIYDIMRTGPGELPFPMPWSSGPTTSFVAEPDQYVSAIEQAGLTAGYPTSRLDLAQTALRSAQTNPPAVNLSHLMGPQWPTMIGNLASMLNDGTLAPIEIIARSSSPTAGP